MERRIKPTHMLPPPKPAECPQPGHRLQEHMERQLRLDNMVVTGTNEMSRPATRRHGGLLIALGI